MPGGTCCLGSRPCALRHVLSSSACLGYRRRRLAAARLAAGKRPPAPDLVDGDRAERQVANAVRRGAAAHELDDGLDEH